MSGKRPHTMVSDLDDYTPNLILWKTKRDEHGTKSRRKHVRQSVTLRFSGSRFREKCLICQRMKTTGNVKRGLLVAGILLVDMRFGECFSLNREIANITVCSLSRVKQGFGARTPAVVRKHRHICCHWLGCVWLLHKPHCVYPPPLSQITSMPSSRNITPSMH